MRSRFHPRLTYANVVASLALFVALGGAGYAAATLDGKNLVDRSVAGKKLKRNTVTGTEVKEATLHEVPAAKTARGLAAPERFHEVDAPGPPAFEHGWQNDSQTGSDPLATAGFYKDQLGIVRLKGLIKGGAIDFAAFILPPGYRPAKRLLFPAGPGRNVVIRADGGVIPEDADDSLDGITFRAGSG